MSSSVAAWVLIVIALIAANLPWVTDRVFLAWKPGGRAKRTWMCLAEWFAMYLLVGALAFGLERKITGRIYEQGWEFVTVTLFLFIVFALPGFIYRFEFRRYLKKR